MGLARTLIFISFLAGTPLPAQESPPVDFLRDVRPLLADHCFPCHGPSKQKSALRLDSREGAFAIHEEGAIIAAGDPAASLLVQRITASDAEERMPPHERDDPLAEAEIATLRRWIAEGAPWAEHWAFVPPVRPEPPPVARAEWCASPIDRFILARLEAEGLAPSPAAARERWLRRASFDITGLPPTVLELDAFLADGQPGAEERVVDRLLASPRHGERQAESWLDIARYADTNGYLYDEPREAWKYREWVIEAFHRGLPYDEFIVEQLAGDLLPEPTLAQRIATGFNRNHAVNSEGGQKPDEYRSAYVIDRVNTAATAFLGLSLACAQCHDHKFDPLSQTDFFRFYAYFDQVEEGEAFYAGNRPRIPVPDADQAPLHADLVARVRALEERLASAADPQFDAAQAAWESRTRARLGAPLPWETLAPVGMIAQQGSTLERLADGSILATGATPVRDTYDLTFRPGPSRIAALRIEVLPDESTGSTGSTGRGPDGRFILSRLEAWVSSTSDASDPPLVWIARAEADLDQEQPRDPDRFSAYPGSIDSAVAGERANEGQRGFRGFSSGWSIVGDECRAPHEAVLIPVSTLELNDASVLHLRLVHAGNPYRTLIARFRISVTADERVREHLLPAAGDVWSAVGPFPAESAAAAFETAFEPEADTAAGLDLAKRYAQPAPRRRDRTEGGAESSSEAPAAEGESAAESAGGAGGAEPAPSARPRRETMLSFEERRIRDGNPIELAGSGDQAWFLTRRIHSTRSRTAELAFEGAAGIRVWLNGKLVHERAPAAAEPAREEGGDDFGSGGDFGRAGSPDTVRIGLREGWNELVVKAVHRGRERRGRGADGGGEDGDFGGYGGRRRGNRLVCSLAPEGEDVLTYEALSALRRAEVASEGSPAAPELAERDARVLRTHYRNTIDPAGCALRAEIARLERERGELEGAMPTALVMEERAEPRATHVFLRGQFDRKGERVHPGVPAVLPPMADDLPRNRLGLARWLVRDDHPLTARVAVNRIWQQYFGTGLVETPGDFGVRGALPSHPELLDWLARELVEGGWDLKRIHRLIALSATYRQDSRATPELLERDPSNRLLARGPRQRLSAEMVRDNALALSGLLVERIGGPSVRPYQPDGLWEAASSRGYRKDSGPDQYRRGIYVYVKRGVEYPSLATFDAAKRDVCVVERSSTITPLQALVLLNDPVHVEAARELGERLLGAPGESDEARIAWGFRHSTSREASEREIALLAALLAEERRHFAADPEAAKKLLGVGDASIDPSLDAAELAAWASVATALLNLDETTHRG